MFVKICGITCPDDAIAAVAAGADAIGLNFVPDSRRRIDLETARAIRAVVPAHVTTVGVFRDMEAGELHAITDTLGLDAAQLHGEEPPAFTHAVARGVATVIKVVTAGRSSPDEIDRHAADIVMLDGPAPGSGVAFDWDLVGQLVDGRRILLAGGLRPGNVADAIRRVGPWGVDVATGVETGDGHKDAGAMARFVEAARTAV